MDALSSLRRFDSLLLNPSSSLERFLTSSEMVLAPQNAASLLKSVENLPVLVIAGAGDALVPLKSSQAMASKLLNSRLVAISGCGHLPHEECPKALLAAMSPFITRLLQRPDL